MRMTFKNSIHIFTLFSLIVGYYCLALTQEQFLQKKQASLSPPLPAQLQKMTLGYLQQISAIFLHIKTNIFLGSKNVPTEKKYADSVALNFEVANELYPQFMDVYFLSQSSLPHIAPEYAKIVNSILDNGSDVYPSNIIYPFFKAFNTFQYIKDYSSAADLYMELGKRPSAPSWFIHFAAILKGKGGNLRAGLIGVKTMLAIETNDVVRSRYMKEIEVFEQAIGVYEATVLFERKYNYNVRDLQDLTPEFIQEIPAFDGGFYMKWIPPNIYLMRDGDEF